MPSTYSLKPVLYDLFSGAGGACRGYQLAGFEVWGIDNRLQPRYCGERFIQADAFAFINAVMRGEYPMPAVWHASPPCQAYSALHAIRSEKVYPDLLAATRSALMETGRPWVIENVPGSPVRSGVTLCGSMFGLGTFCRDGTFHQLRRHRHFESSVFMLAPSCEHRGRPVGVYGNGGGNEGRAYLPGINGFTGNAEERRAAMQIDWMNRGELSQAIPPAYCQFIGARLMEALTLQEATA